MTQRDQICLHTDPDGIVWGMTSSGLPRPIGDSISKGPFWPAVYRVAAAPCNYRLLVELHSALTGKDIQATLLVGKPTLARGVVSDVLDRLSLLEVHDNTPHTWHPMTRPMFNHYLLLRQAHEQGYGDHLEYMLNHHQMRHALKFLGVQSAPLAVELLATIGDPRWFINPNRPHRMDCLYSYFRLMPRQFASVLVREPRMPPGCRRGRLLLEILSDLRPDSFLFRELDQATALQHAMRSCRKILGFVAYNWLELLTNGAASFDVDRFFQDNDNRRHYRTVFRY